MGAEVNHLWPGQQVLAVGLGGAGLGQVGAQVGAALLLGHAHAGEQTGLAVGGAEPEVVRARGQARRPLLRDRVVDPQGRHDGVRHGDGAHVALLGLSPGEEAGRALQVRDGAGRRPRLGGQAEADALGHQPVPGRVELDLVDAVAEAVGGAQDRLVLVGQVPVLAGLGRTGQLAHRADRGVDDLVGLCAAERGHRVHQCWSAVATLCPTSGDAWFSGARCRASMSLR